MVVQSIKSDGVKGMSMKNVMSTAMIRPRILHPPSSITTEQISAKTMNPLIAIHVSPHVKQ
jgi:hypothetical protein